MKFKDIEAKVADGKTLTREEKEFVVAKVDDYWDSHPDVVNRFPRWKKYIAWVAGYQLYDYNKISKKLVEVPIDRERKLIINKLKPYVRTLLSKLNADVPQMGIVPNTSDDEDVSAARIGDKVIEGLAVKLDFDATLNNVKLWTIICNRAYLRVFWNEEDSGVVGYRKKKTAVQDVDKEAPVLEELTGMAKAAAVPADEPVEPISEDGDVCIECVSPFNCRVDPMYFDRNKWRWFLYGDTVDAEWLEDKYGLEEGSLSRNEKSDTMDTAYNLDMQDEQDLVIGEPASDEKVTGRSVVYKELWTPKAYFFVAGTHVLATGPNDVKQIPFFAIEDRTIPISSYEKGFTYNESLIKDVIPIQREYNRMASIMSLALDRASKLKVLTPLGSLLSKKQWVNDYGVFIDYNRNAGEPHQMKLDPFPVEMPAYKAGLGAEMESIFSLSPTSFGRLPERASHPSGTLVNLLLEQDDAVLNSLLNHINATIGKAWTLAMEIVQNKYTISRLIKCVGEYGAEGVVYFKGAQLKGNTDVRVTSQAGLPRSRPLRIEYILKLREVGLLKDDRATLEMLEFGNADKVFTSQMLHERRAQRENAMIAQNPDIDAQGTIGWMYQFEDLAVHLKYHVRDRLSPKYDNYNENQQRALNNHIDATAAQLQKMMAAQMAPPEAPGGAPGGNPPQAAEASQMG